MTNLCAVGLEIRRVAAGQREQQNEELCHCAAVEVKRALQVHKSTELWTEKIHLRLSRSVKLTKTKVVEMDERWQQAQVVVAVP